MDLLPLPVYGTIKPDGTVRLGVNVINKDLLDDDRLWDNYKNCIEKAKENAKNGSKGKEYIAQDSL